jgi:hypothetical protein
MVSSRGRATPQLIGDQFARQAGSRQSIFRKSGMFPSVNPLETGAFPTENTLQGKGFASSWNIDGHAEFT